MTYLQKVQIQNFQSHRNSELEFHPGINIITGESDEGKSAIIRAIRWAVLNKPRGDAFKNWYSKPTDPCSVTLQFANGNSCTRERSSTRNAYLLGNGQEFDAIRTEMPEEVRSTLNLDEGNIQGQNDTYFLLQGTAGEVAKKLNKVVNLEIIDKLLKLVDSKAKQTTKTLAVVDLEIGQMETELASLDHLAEIESLVQKVENGLATFDAMVLKEGTLNNLVELLTRSSSKRGVVEKKVQNLVTALTIPQDLLTARDALLTKVAHLQKLITSSTKLFQQQKVLHKKLQLEKPLENAIRLTESHVEQRKRFRAITHTLESLRVLAQRQRTLSETAIAAKKELIDLITKSGTCPLCGGKLTSTKVEAHIKDWL